MPQTTFSFPTLTLLIALLACQAGLAQEEKLTREPVFRQAKIPGQAFKDRVNESEKESQTVAAEKVNEEPTRIASAESLSVPGVASNNVTPQPAPHPLDAAIELAEEGLLNIRENIVDYTALMVKRERVNGKLGDMEYMRIKVRNHRETNQATIPFSIYMSFVKPKAVKGREVVWVRGVNDNKLSVHEGSGIGALKTFHLDPNSWLAMKGNRYPISEAGLENLTVRLIEKATRDRAAGHCEVQYIDGVTIKNRPCKLIELVHAEQREPFEFHKAQVFIDEEYNIPVRFASYGWPTTPGGKPVLMEEYTYLDVQLNVGLTDADFDIRNPDYEFPNR